MDSEGDKEDVMPMEIDEPTEAMIEAGYAELDYAEFDADAQEFNRAVVVAIYRAMAAARAITYKGIPIEFDDLTKKSTYLASYTDDEIAELRRNGIDVSRVKRPN